MHLTGSIRSVAFSVILLAAGILSGCRAPVATDGGRAALVLRGPDGSVQQACVLLRGSRTNGEQLLLDSGWEVSLDAANPMGSIVCSIDGQGCRFPEESCFCQCGNLGSCSYWAYFVSGADGEWTYSSLGARSQAVRDGDLHAWVWVSGTSAEPGSQQALLPDLTFEQVCPAG